MKHETHTPFVAADGTPCVSVRLSNRGPSWTTTAAAFAELDRAGMTGRFWLSHGARGIGYVTAKLPGYGTQVVARLIAKAGYREQVAYRDGDRLNLHPDNLVLEPCSHARAHSAVVLELCQAAGHKRFTAPVGEVSA